MNWPEAVNEVQREHEARFSSGPAYLLYFASDAAYVEPPDNAAVKSNLGGEIGEIKIA